jgi:hypothetical protein
MMKGKHHEWKIKLPSRPLRIDVDPEFDLFRRLDRQESPPALTQAFGADKVTIIIPSDSENQSMEGSYRSLANTWTRSGAENVKVKLDSELERLPSDRSIALFGWNNRFWDRVESMLSLYDVRIDRESISIGPKNIPRQDHSLVLNTRHPGNKEQALTWVATDNPKAIPGLGRKLPHYHKYSYLVFKGDEPTNILKGRWPVLDSPMTRFLPGKDGTIKRVLRGELLIRKPLATLPPVFPK